MNVHAVCPCICSFCISASMPYEHVHDELFIDHAACPLSMLHVHVHATYPCPCCTSMSMLHDNVHAACLFPCPCCMVMSILHVRVRAAWPCSCCLSMSMLQHGPRSYPLCSSDSEHSQGKTLVFPRLRQCSVHKLSCQMNFCKMMNFQLTPLSKFFPKPCMSAPSLSRHNSSTDLPAELLSAPLVWVRRGGLVPPLQLLYDGPTRSCAVAHNPSPSELGRGMR